MDEEFEKCKNNHYYCATKYLIVDNKPFTTILTEKEFQLDKTEVGTAISWLKDINIQYKQQKYSIYDLTMHPLCFILWDDIPRIS